MSDEVSKKRAPTRQARTRRKGVPRGGRHGLSRPSVPVESGNEMEFVELAPPVATTRRRREVAERPSPIAVMSREAEMAYVRADMRKLFVISGLLLALMLAILVLIGQ